MNAVRAADLRSDRAALDRDCRSLLSQAQWWRAEAVDCGTGVGASYARQQAGRLELRAKALADNMAAIDKQLSALEADAPIVFRPAELKPEMVAGMDDMAGLEALS